MNQSRSPLTFATTALLRWLPLLVLLVAMALAYWFGLVDYLSLGNIASHSSELQSYVAQHLLLALLLYALIYIVVVGLSLPGAALLSILGGFVFGWVVSSTVTVFAATIGAVIVFQIVKTSLGSVVAKRAGSLVKMLSDGFSRDAFNYLLFLRLVPAFPFVAVNAVAGLCRIPLRIFIAATFLGIIPGSLVFALIGRSFGDIMAAQTKIHDACLASGSGAPCPFEISPLALVTPHVLIAFGLLGLMALVPVLLKWRKTSA